MAEFLIMRANGRGGYKKGDIVEVYRDGRCSEAPAPSSKFYIIKVPGLSYEDAKQYMGEDKPSKDSRTITNRRKCKLNLSGMTSAEQGTLRDERLLGGKAISWFNSHLVDRTA